jgi:hypothetical protein
MKKYSITAGFFIAIGILLITSAIASAQNANANANEFTVPLSDPAKRGKLKAHLNYGSITIKGTARKDILVRYTSLSEKDSKKPASKDGLKRIGGGGMDLEASENNNFVKVQSNSWNTKLSLEIEIPSDFDLQVHTYNDGDLIITNVQGDLELTNYNGEITAMNISGSVVATTYNGDIKATFDKVKDGTPMSYSTYNGDIDISFPAALKASLKMQTEQGEIYTGFDINMTSTGPVQKKETRSGGVRIVVDDWRRGDVNGGGAEITMKNYNGDIYVRKK